MLEYKERQYIEQLPKEDDIVLGADIGGTNSNFGFCQLKDSKVILLASVHYKSQQITDFSPVVIEVLNYAQKKFGWHITRGCFAAAGLVSEDGTYAKPTNLKFAINAKELMNKTPLQEAIIINDFQAVGLGYNQISAKDVIPINKARGWDKAAKAIIGAGTGLGKGMLFWDEGISRYITEPSEGGHADFPVQNQKELELIKYIKTTEDLSTPISWENVLSGNGIHRIYQFLKERNNYPETEQSRKVIDNGFHPDQVFAAWNVDQHCNDTIQWYITFYARCAKDFALNTLALSGIYIAGGIAINNVAVFKEPFFMQEFLNNKKQCALLEKIPIYIIADYNVSLYGAAAYLALNN